MPGNANDTIMTNEFQLSLCSFRIYIIYKLLTYLNKYMRTMYICAEKAVNERMYMYMKPVSKAKFWRLRSLNTLAKNISVVV